MFQFVSRPFIAAECSTWRPVQNNMVMRSLADSATISCLNSHGKVQIALQHLTSAATVNPHEKIIKSEWFS